MSASDILAAFRARLQRQFGLAATEIGRWRGTRRSSPNLLELRVAGRAILLYVKVRSGSDGFWGLTEGRLRELASSGKHWRVVLLLGPGEDGYLLTPEEISNARAAQRWSIGGQDFKVHTGRELAGVAAFSSHAALIDAIASAVPS